MCVVEAVVLATGALLLLRKTAGLRLIATGGAGVTMQAVHTIVSWRYLVSLSALGFLTLTDCRRGDCRCAHGRAPVHRPLVRQRRS